MSASAELQGKFCADCGPAGVLHRAEWLMAASDKAFAPLLVPFGAITRLIQPLFTLLRLQYPFAAAARFLAAIRLGTITTRPDEKDNLRTQALWESADRRGIAMWQFRLFGNPNIDFLFAQHGGRLIVFEGLPRPGARSSAALEWMDDKGVLKRKLAAAGLPTAAGGTCAKLRDALGILHRVGPPLIAKPSIGSRSRHTTVGIRTEAELREAFRKAKQLSPWVVVERELSGPVFRGTVIGGKLAGVIRREFPHVVGDGRSTVRALWKSENRNPARQGPIFHVIPEGPETDVELASQGLSWESIPGRGRWVQLHPKASRSFGASTTDVTDETHPDNIQLFEAVAQLLGDPLVGVDFIIDDISVSWKEHRACGVIECNSLPFVDLHHYPLVGTPRDVAGMLWDIVFPEARVTRRPAAQGA